VAPALARLLKEWQKSWHDARDTNRARGRWYGSPAHQFIIHGEGRTVNLATPCRGIPKSSLGCDLPQHCVRPALQLMILGISWQIRGGFSSYPVPSPDYLVFLCAPKLKVHLFHVLESFFDLRGLMSRCKTGPTSGGPASILNSSIY
jgi:hypothetical protein